MPINSFGMMRIWFGMVLLMYLTTVVVSQTNLNCCGAKYSSIGLSCISDVTYNNVTYYCMRTSEACESCSLNSSYSSSQCSSCCVTSNEVCSSDGVTYFSAWSLVLMVFAVSCFCCALVFLTAEQTRIKEGISFQEAYLLPIPMVVAETDLEGKDYVLPRDQPTAIARPHYNLDVPIAEPTESSPLLFR